MRRPLLVLTIAVLLLVRVPVQADELLFVRFADYLESLRIQAGIPGLSAAIVGGDDILWERAFGQQDVERSVAARTDTPFHLDGLTQVFTAALVLRCVEDGRVLLDDRIGRYSSTAADPNATLRQILTHTSGAPESLVFAYRPERLEPLASVVAACMSQSFRATLAAGFDSIAMVDSVPGPDVVRLTPPADRLSSSAIERYAGVLNRLAIPYAVDRRGRPSPSQYAATTLTPMSGVVATTRDLARFDLSLKKGVVLRADTRAAAWQAPLGLGGPPLPHGVGWFVQPYNGETIAWQFGVGENSSSSLIVTVPSRGLTLILLANSDGLVKPFALAAGDVTVSPVGRLFLGLFVR